MLYELRVEFSSLLGVESRSACRSPPVVVLMFISLHLIATGGVNFTYQLVEAACMATLVAEFGIPVAF